MRVARKVDFSCDVLCKITFLELQNQVFLTCWAEKKPHQHLVLFQFIILLLQACAPILPLFSRLNEALEENLGILPEDPHILSGKKFMGQGPQLWTPSPSQQRTKPTLSSNYKNKQNTPELEFPAKTSNGRGLLIHHNLCHFREMGNVWPNMWESELQENHCLEEREMSLMARNLWVIGGVCPRSNPDSAPYY